MAGRRWRYLLPLLVLWLAFGLRLYHLDFQSIWWDEGHSIFVASQSLAQIPTLPAMDVHPPAYFALLHLWLGLAGDSEFALRYLSVLFSLLTLPLLWRFAALLSRPRSFSPCLVALFAALSPLYVAYAQEVRSYAMITCLALASTLTLWRLLYPGWRQDTAKKRNLLWLVYVIVTTACLYTHYFTLFLLLFHNLTWLAWLLYGKFSQKQTDRLLSRLGWWLASQVGILLLFSPQLPLALRQTTSYTNPNLIPPTLTYFISRCWQAYTVGLTIDPTPAWWGMAVLAGVLLVNWLIVFWTSRPKPIIPFVFLSAWFIIPLAAYFVVLQRQPSFEPRYMMLVTPALFLALSVRRQVSGVKYQVSIAKYQAASSKYQAIRNTLFSLLAALPSLLCGLILLIGLYSYYTNETYFKDDSAGVADWLAAKTTANDIVYIDVPHPFHYYVAKGHIAAPTRYLFVDIHTAADTLNREAAGRRRLFWVTWSGSDTDPRGVIPFLAQKPGQKLDEINFRGYKVEVFSLSAAPFSLPIDLPPVNAVFGDALRLDGAATSNKITLNQPAWATLHFTLLRPTPIDYKVSARLRGDDGRIVAQIDKDLFNDRHFRTSAWPLTDAALNQAINVYLLPLAAGTPPGVYRLEVVVYNSQPPYPSEGVTGPLSADGGTVAVLGRVTVEASP